jgi:conjugative transfer pilus assembly protein TraH
VGTVTEGQTISVLADMVANAYILQMMSDLYLRAEAIAVKAREVVEKKGAASNGSTETCAAPIFLENASKDIAVMLGKINSLKEGSKTNYIAAREEMIANLQAIETMKNLESQMNQEVTRRFGKDVVARVN